MSTLKEADAMESKKKDKLVKKKKVTLDKTSDKYKMLLKYCNKLLANIEGFGIIKDPLELSNVNRLDLIKDENQQVFKDMMDDIYGVYDKAKCGYYQRKAVNAPLNSLRSICKDIGLKLEVNKKNLIVKDQKGAFRTCYYYTIINL